jgi:predicted nucleic acid-binding protein
MDYLLDSSVVIKWFFKERHSDKALKIQDDYLDGEINLIIPDLLFYEVANGLKYSPYRISKERVEKNMESLMSLKLETIPFNLYLFRVALDLMFEFGITIYDAYFLSLARELRLFFITADEKLYLKIKILPFVRHLGHI